MLVAKPPVVPDPREQAGQLILVATPLGNLGDMTERITTLLREVPVVACEDTRVTRKILSHLGASPRMLSVREANEAQGARQVIDCLAAGDDVAYCTDAGTPGVSDPGRVLVDAVRDAGYRIDALPGPNAVALALALSGMPADRFVFAGFLPAKTSARCRELDAVRTIPWTLVFYETPHRLADFLVDAAVILGPRRTAICREMTKLHQEVIVGMLGSFPERDWRGEITVVIAGASPEVPDPAGLEDWVRGRLGEDPGLRIRDLAREAAEKFGVSGSDAYRVVLALKAP